MAAILGKSDTLSPDSFFVRTAHEIYEDRDRTTARTLLKHEFIAWVEKQMFDVSPINVDTVYAGLFVPHANAKQKGILGYVELKRISLSEIYGAG